MTTCSLVQSWRIPAVEVRPVIATQTLIWRCNRSGYDSTATRDLVWNMILGFELEVVEPRRHTPQLLSIEVQQSLTTTLQ